MTTIIVLTSEENAPERVGISHAGPVTVQQAEMMCNMAAGYFRKQAIEAEVQRRLDAERAKGKEEDDDQP